MPEDKFQPQNSALLMTDAEVRGRFSGIVLNNWTISEANEAYNDAYVQAQKQVIYVNWLLSAPGSDAEAEYAEQLEYINRVSGAGRGLDREWYTS